MTEKEPSGNMDDELRRFLESPEDKIRRIHEEDRLALEKEIRNAELAEARRIERKSKQAQLKDIAAEKAEATKQRRHRQRIPRRIGMVAAGLAVVGATSYGVYQSIPPVVDKASLTDVDALREHGACAPELRAESQIAAIDIRYARNKTLRKNAELLSKSFENAAELAEKNDISCFPVSKTSDDLTPNFDVAELKTDRRCADEIKAEVIEPLRAENDFWREKLEVEQKTHDLQISLAKQHDVPC